MPDGLIKVLTKFRRVLGDCAGCSTDQAGVLAGSGRVLGADYDVRMTLDEFRQTLANSAPPAVTALLKALWHDARGDWEQAHRIAQDIDTTDAAWVHAYLHRKEGDLSNARYWYGRAGEPEAADSFDSEWSRIVSALLAKASIAHGA